jgi:SAM-dependent methyltransferase
MSENSTPKERDKFKVGEMLRKGIRTIDKKGLRYVAENGNGVKRFKPWLGDSFSFLYDFIMKSSILPKIIGADMSKHYEVLGQTLKSIHSERVLELATGSGSAVHFLEKDNQYTGTDISPGLLRKAVRGFRAAGFTGTEFYVTSADDLPFDDSTFSICLCILSLNFFNDIKRVFQEIKRVLVPGGVLVCCVPVPERNTLQSTIRGTLYSEEELAELCNKYGFRFESIPFENGALLYFRALLIK